MNLARDRMPNLAGGAKALAESVSMIAVSAAIRPRVWQQTVELHPWSSGFRGRSVRRRSEAAKDWYYIIA